MIDNKLIEILPTLPIIENPQDINEASRLEHDLGLSGYPARSLMFRYSETFNIDTSKFQFSKYFSNGTISDQLYRKLFNSSKNTLTIGHLQIAINYGTLNERTINDINNKHFIPKKGKKIHLKTKGHSLNLDEIIIYTLVCITLAVVLAVVAFII